VYHLNLGWHSGDGIGSGEHLWAAAAADEVEGVTVDEIAVVVTVAVAVGDSRRQRQKRLGYAAGRKGREWVVGLNSGILCDFEGLGWDNQGQYFWEGGQMLEMGL